MSIIQGTAKSGGGGAASFYDYPIGDSLRFDGSSYLSKTFGSGGSATTWTISFWFKLGNISITGNEYLLSAGSGGAGFQVRFNSSNKLDINNWTGAAYNLRKIPSMVFRDTSSFYHMVLNFSSLTSASDIYINGNLITFFDTNTDPSASSYFNSIVTHRIGEGLLASGEFEGYLANIQFIDGQALDPYFFGEFKDNVWVPYNAFSTAGSGTATASDGDTATDSYGTNGFHLDFADSSNIGNDVSGNNNDWTVN